MYVHPHGNSLHSQGKGQPTHLVRRHFNWSLHHWHRLITSWVPLLLFKHLFPLLFPCLFLESRSPLCMWLSSWKINYFYWFSCNCIRVEKSGPLSSRLCLVIIKASDTTKVLETEGASLLLGTRNLVRSSLMLLLCSQFLLFVWIQGPCPEPDSLISVPLRDTVAYVSGGHVLQPAEVSTRLGQVVSSELQYPRLTNPENESFFQKEPVLSYKKCDRNLSETSSSELKKGKPITGTLFLTSIIGMTKFTLFTNEI